MNATGPSTLLGTAVLLGWLFVGAPAAYASCAGPPEPSPYAFVGRVIATESAQRVATVLTAGGETVQVAGTPSPDNRGVTSVDRTYQVGAVYEFHPTNGTDPFQDNNCTMTHRLRGHDIPAPLREGSSGADAEPQHEPGNVVAAAALAGVTVVGATAGGAWLRRRHARS